MAHTMIDCVCEQCKNPFQVTLGTFNRGTVKFCSRFCHYQNVRDQSENRFWAQVDKTSNPNGCWIWLGTRQKQGYGRFFANGWHAAHRYAWALKNGKIPKGLLACHRCDNPPCCNPDHIFLGTYFDNSADMMAKGRGMKGHSYMDGRSRGEKNPRAKLNEEQVREIRNAYPGDGRTRKNGRVTNKATGPTLKSLAKQYGVSFSVIHSIVAHKNWTNID